MEVGGIAALVKCKCGVADRLTAQGEANARHAGQEGSEVHATIDRSGAKRSACKCGTYLFDNIHEDLISARRGLIAKLGDMAAVVGSEVTAAEPTASFRGSISGCDGRALGGASGCAAAQFA